MGCRERLCSFIGMPMHTMHTLDSALGMWLQTSGSVFVLLALSRWCDVFFFDVDGVVQRCTNKNGTHNLPQ